MLIWHLKWVVRLSEDKVDVLHVQQAEGPAKEAMQKLEGIEFKKKTLSTEYSTINKEVYRARFQAKEKASLSMTAAAAADNDTRSPAERLADQVTPLYK